MIKEKDVYKMKKAGARKALKFFEENYIMICGLEAKDEKGCADKCLEILRKYIENTTVTQQNIKEDF